MAYTSLYYPVHTMMSDGIISTLIDEMQHFELEDSSVVIDGEAYASADRRSKQTWMPSRHWLESVCVRAVQIANDAYFHFDLTDISGGIQYTVYDKNDHFDWHRDGTWNMVEDNLAQRKLSVSLLLSDPSEYEGGELEFIEEQTDVATSLKPQRGTAIVFPSWVKHRVAPIKSGQRISCVGWYLGPRIK